MTWNVGAEVSPHSQLQGNYDFHFMHSNVWKSFHCALRSEVLGMADDITFPFLLNYSNFLLKNAFFNRALELKPVIFLPTFLIHKNLDRRLLLFFAMFKFLRIELFIQVSLPNSERFKKIRTFSSCRIRKNLPAVYFDLFESRKNLWPIMALQSQKNIQCNK